ncbi:hemerythrin domain-containing protein [Parachitinimonas caeni]|uniref:Hemerythrin domain-containing protein n=1 Tax=Parachitinimonas caeni TaxID=3031301 RepID=A0ABT7E0B2_9NEIS|nr:hemerythrin domain-containing protein [Parachitinimonas caeni]MDK2125749.1 hemerythrin domain-containing protein [Parachitinimonas caeni]
MNTISYSMTCDHKACDDQFVAAETAARHGDWQLCRKLSGQFEQALSQHFLAEEDILFPRFETLTGMTQGPTAVMRAEHAAMRDIVFSLRHAAASESLDDFLGHADTLLVYMQQHNLKEENMLYPMMDRALHAETGALLDLVQQQLAVQSA